MKWSEIKMSPKHANWIVKTFSSIFNIAEGGVRSGKTTDMILAFCKNLEKLPARKAPYLHLAAAESIGTAKNILVEGGSGLGIKPYFGEARAKDSKYKNKDALIVELGPNKKHIIIIAGHSKSDSWKSIHGLTLTFVILTEANLAHMTFINASNARTLMTPISQRKIFHDLNPISSKAAYYTEFLDKKVTKDIDGDIESSVNYDTFSLFDNPALEEDQRLQILSEYDPESPYFKAMILGLRINTANLVYIFRDYNKGAAEIPPIREYSIGIDVGETLSATTFVTIAWGIDNKLYLISSRYHRNGKKSLEDQTFKTFDNYVDDFVEYYKETVALMGRVPRYIFTDRDQAFYRLLYNRFAALGLPKNLINYAYKDKIADRITTLSTLLYQGNFIVLDKEENELVIDAFNTAVYSEKDLQKGDLVRHDDTTLSFNPIDVLDPIEYLISYYYRVRK